MMLKTAKFGMDGPPISYDFTESERTLTHQRRFCLGIFNDYVFYYFLHLLFCQLSSDSFTSEKSEKGLLTKNLMTHFREQRGTIREITKLTRHHLQRGMITSILSNIIRMFHVIPLSKAKQLVAFRGMCMGHRVAEL